MSHLKRSSYKKYLKIIKNIEIDKTKNPVKIAIVGEFYTVIEPFTNLYIEEKLMNYGVNIRKLITTRWWVKDMLLKSIKLNSIHIRKASKKYLNYYIGGHARECVGEIVLAHKDGYDGAIQIYPMGCTPQIISKSIISSISRDKEFSVMTLVIDEITGELGYITRIEAFIDLLERKRKNVLRRN